MQSLDFSEGTGTTLNDKTSNGNNATVIGGTWTTDRYGRSNRAILLDGVDDYIDLGLANYQGTIGFLISAKILSVTDSDPIIGKGNLNSISYTPHFQMSLRTTNNAINTLQRVGAGTQTTWGGNFTNGYIIDSWGLFYASASISDVGTHGSNGRQFTSINDLIDLNFVPGYSIKLGRNESTAFSNIVVDRIMLFNRFLSGHELSKISNRLKIGDLDK